MFSKSKKRWVRRALRTAVGLFVAVNVIAIFHAYRFTHFSEASEERVRKPEEYSFLQRVEALFLGVPNHKLAITQRPTMPYETIRLEGEENLVCWSIPADSAKGTVVLFHGYKNNKSSMVERAAFFVQQGYNALLVDFAASGESDGHTCTVGHREAEQVKRAYDHVRAQGQENIHLFGNSMGAAAITKAMKDHDMEVETLMLECPFGSMYQTTCARFSILGVPQVPLAGILLFWGGAINGFWAFSHNPQDYAASIETPTLLLYGEQDSRVSPEETEAIYQALAGEKKLLTFPATGHEDYLINNASTWKSGVINWMEHRDTYP